MSCKKNEPKITTFEGIAHTIPYQIHIAEPLSKSNRKDIISIIETNFQKIDATFNHWNPNSEISKINHAKAHIPIEVSSELVTLIAFTKALNKVTSNRYNPLCGAAISSWKQALPVQCIPSATYEVFTFDDFYLDKEKLIKTRNDLQFDFDGIIKGVLVDLISENFFEMGLQNFFVSWGGEVYAHGKHSSKRSWMVGIKLNDQTVAIPLSNEAIATSGSLVQSYNALYMGKSTKFTHIIDPKTNIPLVIKKATIESASIKAPYCALADALATATMIFDSKQAATTWFESTFSTSNDTGERNKLHTNKNNLQNVKLWINLRSN